MAKVFLFALLTNAHSLALGELAYRTAALLKMVGMVVASIFRRFNLCGPTPIIYLVTSTMVWKVRVA